jgi:hypothetical protein
MKRVVLLCSTLVIAGLLVPKAYSQACDGNACNDVKVNYDGSCYHAVNSGSQMVRVEFSPLGFVSSVSKVLASGEDWKPQLFGGACLSAFKDAYHANYAGGIVVDPDIRDSTDERASGVLDISKGQARRLTITVPDRKSKPSCEQIRNFLPNGQQYHNLGCSIEGQNADGSWGMTITMSPSTGGLYWFQISAAGAPSRVGTVHVP